MSEWHSNYKKDEILKAIENCFEELQRLEGEEFNEAVLGRLQRANKVLNLIRPTFNALDPELFPTNHWGNFPSWLNSARAELSNFRANKNNGHLTNVHNHLDEVLKHLRPYVSLPTEKVVEVTIEATEQFRDKASAEVARIREERDLFKKQLDELSKELEQVKQHLTETDSVIESQKSRLDTSISEFQSQFSTTESERASKFATALEKATTDRNEQATGFEESFEEELESQKTRFNKLETDVTERSDKLFEFFTKREAEVERIYGAVGSAEFAGNFKLVADTEAKAANFWRWVAVVLMLGMVVMAGTTFYYSIRSPQVDWQSFLFRLTTSFVIAIPAVYAARESTRHRERERMSRKAHLELASIDAYLVKLPDDKQHELKEKLTEKFFGNQDVVEMKPDKTNHAILALLEKTINHLTKS